ncbi:choice-of-anchor tandem repeat GloVer-containing protein [Chryseolinea sp. T2]|uniref:choice-of-anchor tandem repeat GloVer-containing protein n=1 Tax=Chryseolinea sp. T2 TaxID=3129255 RepID=UPI00307889A4
MHLHTFHPASFPSSTEHFTRNIQYQGSSSGSSNRRLTVFCSAPAVRRLLLIVFLLAAGHYASSQAMPEIFAVTANGGKLNGGTVLRIGPAANPNVTASSNFGVPLNTPRQRNVLAPNGYLYNFADWGNQGGLFRIRPDGSDYEQLHGFGSGNGSTADQDGFTNTCLTIDADNVIYGSTFLGGGNGSGVIYRINGDGTHYRKLLDFPSASTYFPDGMSLILGSDGFLYGTQVIGENSLGSIYKVATNGTGFKEIFSLHDENLANPIHLHRGTDDLLYSIARIENSSNYMLFRINADGTGYQSLHELDNFIQGDLIEASDGYLYGTSLDASTSNSGYAYRCATDGSEFEIIHHFDSKTGMPLHGVREGPDLLLYGATSEGGAFNTGVVFKMNHDGTGFDIVYDLPYPSVGELSFIGDASNLDILLFSMGGATQAGNLYRIHNGQGDAVYNFNDDKSLAVSPTVLSKIDEYRMHMLANQRNEFDKASLVKVSAVDGSVEFVTEKIAAGSNGPISQMVRGDDGYWYWIGHPSVQLQLACILRGASDGTAAQIIRGFSVMDGAMPFEDITVNNGWVYGSCRSGGTANRGLIYRAKIDGGYEVLHRNQAVAYMPTMTIGPDDRIYAADNGVFSMKLDGSDKRMLHEMPSDLAVSAPLTVLGDQIFGVMVTTSSSSDFAGALFTMNIDGSGYRVLHTFTGADGAFPFTALYPFQGRLFGATNRLGDNGWGTLFSLNLATGNLNTFKHLDHETGYQVGLRLVGTCHGQQTPSITVEGNTLTSNSQFGNQWYRNGVAMPGALGATLEVTESGDYQVQTLFADCRSELSTATTMSVMGIEEEQSGIGFYPNPTTGKVVLTTGTSESETVNILVRNATGHTIAEYEGHGGDLEFDFTNVPPGLYLATISSGDRKVHHRKLVKR